MVMLIYEYMNTGSSSNARKHCLIIDWKNGLAGIDFVRSCDALQMLSTDCTILR